MWNSGSYCLCIYSVHVGYIAKMSIRLMKGGFKLRSFSPGSVPPCLVQCTLLYNVSPVPAATSIPSAVPARDGVASLLPLFPLICLESFLNHSPVLIDYESVAEDCW